MTPIRISIILFFFIFMGFGSVYAQEPSGRVYFEIAQKALENKDFDNAYKYFLKAKEKDFIDPRLASYISILAEILRHDKTATVEIGDEVIYATSIPSEIPQIDQKSDSSQRMRSIPKKAIERPAARPLKKSEETSEEKPEDSVTLGDLISGKKEEGPLPSKKTGFPLLKKIKSFFVADSTTQLRFSDRIRDYISKHEFELKEQVIELEGELSKTPIKKDVAVSYPTAIHGRNITRFIVDSPTLAEIQRVDADTITINVKVLSVVKVYVWDSRGRWELHIKGFNRADIYNRYQEELELGRVEYVRPFDVKYEINNRVAFTGNGISLRKQLPLITTHLVSTTGESPYGPMDAAFTVQQQDFKNSDLSYLTLGLTRGHIGPVHDVSLRLVDSVAEFSDYTISGESIRGVNAWKYWQEGRWAVNYAVGQQKSRSLTFGDLGNERKVYLQGLKLRYDDVGKYSLNLLNGFGSDHNDNEADIAMSADFDRLLTERQKISGEVAYDTEKLASKFVSSYQHDHYSWGFDANHVDAGFKKVVGENVFEGQTAANLNSSLFYEKWSLAGRLGVNKEEGRNASTTSSPDAWNYSAGLSSAFDLSQTGNIGLSVGYSDQRASVDEAKNTNYQAGYNKKINISDTKSMSTNVSAGYDMTRSAVNPTKDLNRLRLGTGVYVPFRKGFSWDINYYQTWNDYLEDFNQDYESAAWRTSFGGYQDLSKKFRHNYRIFYDDELKGSGLTPERDQVGLSYDLTYRLSDASSLFFGTTVYHNLKANTADKTQASASWGMRTHWITPWMWNPKGIVEGVVFADVNRNQRLDFGEAGIPDILVKVGNKELVTDGQGRYATYIKAKKVKVIVIKDKLAPGFVFTTDFMQEANIEGADIVTNHFGLVGNTSVIGIVFIDANKNGILDPNEELVSGVTVVLDNEKSMASDVSGEFEFFGISPGDHMIKLDVNTLPENHLPKIKVQQKVNVPEATSYKYWVPIVPVN